MDISIWAWVGFHAVIFFLLALDLGVFHRSAHEVKVQEAAIWTVIWISLSLLFNLGLSFWLGQEAGLNFLAGYLIEYSLSVDNIFIFVLLFSFFRVPAAYQHRVLFWGILGALIMRGSLILLGSALIERFEWIIYIFGAFLVFTGLRMFFSGDDEEEDVHPEGNVLVRVVRRFLPVTKEMRGPRFFVKEDGMLMATPLLIVLLIVESTDLIFAVDSIPAIFGITHDAFIVYTSNICAILGLRSLYFLLAGVMDKFHYLKTGLAVILTFVGMKMLWPEITYLALHERYEIPNLLSLGVIIATLSVAIIASLIRARRLEGQQPAEVGQ
ncbi:TerC family protein [Oscillochloris sp. ZM17-4]|uniref:TerC family protein n=1 Tax=Oscillochloris sp. ZM17-4 TaxID=2866714 RepID=UPI001C7368B8|nr:TerC family protein [Oscillochloris sp. ZM17-4]